MIQQLEKIARQPIRGTTTETLDYERHYGSKEGKSSGIIVFIKFIMNDNEAMFEGIESTEFKEPDARLYLWQDYTKYGSNASPKVPTLRVFNKKAPRELYLSDENKVDILSLSSSKKAKKLHKCLKQFPVLLPIAEKLHQEKLIADELESHIKGIEEFLLSLKINGKMIGESEYFEEEIQSQQQTEIAPEYYTIKGKKYFGHNKLCSITTAISDEVYGVISIEKFYAVQTNPNVVAGGFNAKLAWKNFPMSKEGILLLEKAHKFVTSELRFKFCKLDYFLLPTPVLNTPNDEYSAIVSDFKKFSLTDEAKQESGFVELDIVSALAEQQNIATYTLFFFKESDSEFKILASIDDVFPSYMRRVYAAREAVEKLSFFHNLRGKDKTLYNLRFDFRLVQHFFNTSKMDGDNTYHFLNIVRSVFMQKNVDYSFLLQAIMRRARKSSANGDRFDLDALKGYMLLCFLAKLNLLHPFSSHTMSKEISVDASIEAFFKEHEGFFDYGSPLKRAVFLEGVLAQKLLYIQQVERGSQPFYARLNGLNINRKIFERILPEIHAKLTEYDKFYPNYRRLSEAISAHTVACEAKDWKLSDDEYSFYFTLGMALAKQFYPTKESSTETTSNEENAQ